MSDEIGESKLPFNNECGWSEYIGYRGHIWVREAEAQATLSRYEEALREIADEKDHPSWRKAKAIARAVLQDGGSRPTSESVQQSEKPWSE